MARLINYLRYSGEIDYEYIEMFPFIKLQIFNYIEYQDHVFVTENLTYTGFVHKYLVTNKNKKNKISIIIY